MSAELKMRKALYEQRATIVAKIEEAATQVETADRDEGAEVVAAVLRQAAEIARWVPFDPSPKDVPR